MKGMSISKVFTLFGIIYFLVTPFCIGATYYVDANHQSASDTNPGTLDQPWLTITHAIDTLTAGDTVMIREGTYFENLYITQSGNATDGHIVVSNYQGESPIVDGTGVAVDNGIVISNASYIDLVGLEVRNWDGGIITWNTGPLEISDCTVHDVSVGIGLYDGTHDFVLNGVVVHHFDYAFDVSPSGGNGCYNGTLNDCVAHTGRERDQLPEGAFEFSHQGDQHDFALNRCEAYSVHDAFTFGGRDIVLNRCSAHDSDAGFKIWGDNVTLVNCIGYSNSEANLETGWTGNQSTVTVRNCTFMGAPLYNIWMEGQAASIEDSGDLLYMYNCIIAGGQNIGLLLEKTAASNYHGDHNVFHMDSNSVDRAISMNFETDFSLQDITSGQWTTYSGQDSHSLIASSAATLFVDPTNFDFHLRTDSPAIDSGTSTDGPSDDFDGNTRPQGSRYDIGAYEYSTVDGDGDGFAGDEGDCDDTNPDIYPGAPEVCDDGTDNDCDGDIDEGCDIGNLVTSDLWIRAVIDTEEKGSIDAIWQKGGEDTTSRGDRVIWGHFYAGPADVTWGSANNPDLFVKIWFDHSGRLDVNFFHVSVPDIEVYSDYPYDGTPDEHGTTTMERRYIRQYYEEGQSHSEENYEDGVAAAGYSPAGNPWGSMTINDLRIGSIINTVEKGPIDAVWRLGGQDTTARGDQVVWGHFYASPSDVTWGSQDNPDLFVKIWFDESGRVDVNFFHVSVPDIEVYSDLPSDVAYDHRGTTIMADRYIRHEYQR